MQSRRRALETSCFSVPDSLEQQPPLLTFLCLLTANNVALRGKNITDGLLLKLAKNALKQWDVF